MLVCSTYSTLLLNVCNYLSMKMVQSRFGNLGIVVGLLGTLSQVFLLATVSHAKSPAEFCQPKMKYAVFAKHSLPGKDRLPDGRWRDTTNTAWRHEHIFFCDGGQLVDNVGFGPLDEKDPANLVGAEGRRFKYSTEELQNGKTKDGSRLDDFELIDVNRYDSDIISELIDPIFNKLGKYPDRCDLRTIRDYNLLTNNCQHFVAKVKEEYKKRMLSGTWTRNLTPFQGNSRGCFVSSANGTAKEITLSQNNYQITVPGKFAKVDDGYTSGAKGEARGNSFNLTDAGGGFIITYAGKITDYGNTLSGKAICRYGSGSASATSSFIWKRKAIGPSIAEGL